MKNCLPVMVPGEAVRINIGGSVCGAIRSALFELKAKKLN